MLSGIKGNIYYLTWHLHPNLLFILHLSPTQDSNYNFIVIDPKSVAYIAGYLCWLGFESTLQHDFNSRPFEIYHMGWCVLVSYEIENCYPIPFNTSFISTSTPMSPGLGDITLLPSNGQSLASSFVWAARVLNVMHDYLMYPCPWRKYTESSISNLGHLQDTK